MKQIDWLQWLLMAAAMGQLLLAVINLRIDRILSWNQHLATLPLLLREVFKVHQWFISVILTIFGVLTLRFAGILADGSSDLGRWLCFAIAGFWGLRTMLQWTFYSSTHWKGIPKETAIHWFLTIAYGGCAVVYFLGGLAG